jgi:hypothetical protein
MTRRLLLLAAFAATASYAQETMARLYIMPITGVGTREDPRVPKYRNTILTPNGTIWAMMDYGYRSTCLLAAETSAIVHNALVANSDVFAFPDNFQVSGATVSSQSTAVQTSLEGFGIPAHWVQSQDTYLSVAHTTGAMFQFAQGLNGILGNVDPFAGATLNTQFRNLAQATQDATHQVGARFGWDTSGITPTMTLRNMVKYMADQWGATPLLLGPFIF